MTLLAVFMFIAWMISKDYPAFLRVYSLFFAMLLLMAANKAEFGVSADLATGAFAPFSLARWAMLFVFLLYSLDYFHRRRTSSLNSSFVILCSLMLIDIMASNLYSLLPNYSLMRSMSILLLFGSLVFGVQTFFVNEQHCINFIGLMYRIGGIVILAGAVLYVVRPGMVYGTAESAGRYAGITGNPNQLATFSAMIAPFVMYHCLQNTSLQSPVKTGIAWGIWLLMVFGLYLSGSRSAAIVLIVVSILYAFLIKPHARIPSIWILMMSLLFMSASFTVTSQVQDFFYREHTTMEAAVDHSRGNLWGALMPFLWEKSVWGYGFAASFTLTTHIVGHALTFHNSFLETFGDLGGVGLSLLILLLGYITAMAVRLIRSSRNEFERQIDAVFVSCFVGGLIDAFFESWLFSVGNNSALMFWVPATIIVTRASLRMNTEPPSRISEGHYQ